MTDRGPVEALVPVTRVLENSMKVLAEGSKDKAKLEVWYRAPACNKTTQSGGMLARYRGFVLGQNIFLFYCQIYPNFVVPKKKITARKNYESWLASCKIQRWLNTRILCCMRNKRSRVGLQYVHSTGSLCLRPRHYLAVTHSNILVKLPAFRALRCPSLISVLDIGELHYGSVACSGKTLGQHSF